MGAGMTLEPTLIHHSAGLVRHPRLGWCYMSTKDGSTWEVGSIVASKPDLWRAVDAMSGWMNRNGRIAPGAERQLRDYIEHGLCPGGFLEAVARNNLRDAVACADEDSQRVLQATVRWLHTNAPSRCWGGAEAVANWKWHRGLSGLEEARSAAS